MRFRNTAQPPPRSSRSVRSNPPIPNTDYITPPRVPILRQSPPTHVQQGTSVGSVSPLVPPRPSTSLVDPFAYANDPETGLRRIVTNGKIKFLLGDGAGMGKGRTLAGFVVENIARGRKKHIWVSVSQDLYEDAKRDLSDLGLSEFAENNCFNLGKLPYSSLVKGSSSGGGLNKKAKGKKGKRSKAKSATVDPTLYEEGVMFSTYSTLIGMQRTGSSRLEQLIEWCGGEDFDGLIMFDECHKAKSIDLDCDGNATNVGKNNLCSKTAEKVVLLQERLPRARVVYCSATSVSESKNLGFMSRLGLWGPGTEHPSGFNQFLTGLDRLGTGAMELHAMHLKSSGALVARSLSYEACEFSLINNVGDDKVRSVYNRATELWTDLQALVAERCAALKKQQDLDKKLQKIEENKGEVPEDLLFHRSLHYDSDTEDEDEDDDALIEQRSLRRKFRKSKPGDLKALYWGAHQRFFKSSCTASKVDTAIKTANQALENGHCCVIGLQSTGEARAKGAAKAAGVEKDESLDLDGFVSAPKEDLKRIIAQISPLPPKPKGVIAPEFLNVAKREDITTTTDTEEDGSPREDVVEPRSTSSRPSRRAARQSVGYSELNIDDEGHDRQDSKKAEPPSPKKRKPKRTKLSKKKKRRSNDDSMDLDSDDDRIDRLLDSYSESDHDDDDNDDDASLSDNEGTEDDKDYASDKSSGGSKVAWNEIPMDLDDSTMSFRKRVEYKRMVNYRRCAERVKKWFDTVDELSLPPNPLDRLLNELGGPDKVAELTGRKTRQVKRYNTIEDRMKVTIEKRKGEGRLDQINLEEKASFQNGEKLVAILSEAASTGISLHADKRVKNQRRRVHITLELPWSAEKAIQQLGRSHCSNQSSGPIYKFLISDVGAEARFASAVARRLALLGALTQGDRRATGSANSLGLGSFDIDNIYGRRALNTMLDKIFSCSTNSNDVEASDQLSADALKVIDSHIATCLQESQETSWRDALVPYDDDSETEKTFGSFMYHLLVEQCEKLAESRVLSIRENRSVAGYLDALESGAETMDEIKPKIDAELKAAREAGLNTNICAKIWLFDVGVQSDSKGLNVPKFLNRALGMRLNRQSVMTTYFMKCLEKEIYSAKSARTYDIGIKTLSGNKVEFAGKPCSFCFRGLAAKDERVDLYAVNLDLGISSDVAMEMYNTAKENEPEQQDNSGDIVSGFYLDDREYLRGGKKVFLYVNPGDHSPHVIVVRPNSGRYVEDKSKAREKIRKLNPMETRRAKELWDTEFVRADRPWDEIYQLSCRGRHRETHIFSGNIVPVLNKMLAAGGISSGVGVNRDSNFPRIVRVETSLAAEKTVAIDAESDSEIELSDAPANNVGSDEDDDARIRVSGEGDVGKGIASKFLGNSVFRGTITKYKDDGEYGDCDSSGTFYVHYSTGRKMKMDSDKVKHALHLFASEEKKLVRVGVSKVDASSLEEHTSSASLLKARIRKPILDAQESEDPDDYEAIYECEFEGKVPDSIVGIEFPRKEVWMKDSNNADFKCLLHEKVLHNVAKKLIMEGVENSYSLASLERTEAKSFSKSVLKKKSV